VITQISAAAHKGAFGAGNRIVDLIVRRSVIVACKAVSSTSLSTSHGGSAFRAEYAAVVVWIILRFGRHVCDSLEVLL